jgi:hypothetical protein
LSFKLGEMQTKAGDDSGGQLSYVLSIFLSVVGISVMVFWIVKAHIN